MKVTNTERRLFFSSSSHISKKIQIKKRRVWKTKKKKKKKQTQTQTEKRWLLSKWVKFKKVHKRNEQRK